jgi:hypothetical protein
MIFIEFPENLTTTNFIVRYRNVLEEDWYYIWIDIETLNILIQNFGIISTLIIPSKPICIDNPTTSKTICIKYCGANIKLICNNNKYMNISLLEQNY